MANITRSMLAGSLALTGLAPAYGRSDFYLIYTGTTAYSSSSLDRLTLTGRAPTVTASLIATDRVITPSAGTLALTGLAPSLARTELFVTVGVGALSVSGLAPAPWLGSPEFVMGVGTLAMTPQVPTLGRGYWVIHDNPTTTEVVTQLLSVSGNITVTPGSETLTVISDARTQFVQGGTTYGPLVAGGGVAVDGGATLPTLVEGVAIQIGLFTYSNPATQPLPWATGIVLSTGQAVDMKGPNSSARMTTDLGLPGDADINVRQRRFPLGGDSSFDAAALELRFTTTKHTLEVACAFGSEEYEEFVPPGAFINDMMLVLLDGVNITLIPGMPPDAAGETLVCVGTLNALTPYGVWHRTGSSLDIQADGIVMPIWARAAVTPGVEHTLKFVVADAARTGTRDATYDAWLFLGANTLRTFDEEDSPVIVVDVGTLAVEGRAPRLIDSHAGATIEATLEPPCQMRSSEPWIRMDLLDTSVTTGEVYDGYELSQVGKPLNQSLTEPAGLYGGRKPGRVVDFGTVHRRASDPITGEWSAQTQQVTLDDAARFVAWLREQYGGDLVRGQWWQYLTSDAWRRLGGRPRLLFQGLIQTDTRADHLRETLEAVDVIGNAWRLHVQDVQIPQRVILGTGISLEGETLDFPGYLQKDPRTLQRVPILVGRYSDETRTLPAGYVVGGAAVVIDVGDLVCADAVTRRAGLLCGHALTGGGIINLYQRDGDDPGLIPSGDYGVSVWAPGRAGWATVNPSGAALYTDLNGHRYTLIFLSGSRADDLASASRPIYANCAGPDTNADGTGTELVAVHELKRWLWLNWIEPTPGYQSGPWLSPSTFEYYPGELVLARIDEASFTQSAAVAVALFGDDGAWGAQIGPGAQDRRQVIADMNRSSHSLMRWNDWGQIGDVMLDRRRSEFLRGTRSLTAYRRQDIQADPAFHVEGRADWHCTNLHVLYGYSARDGQYTADLQIGSTPPPFLKYGSVLREIELPYVCDTGTAETIAQQRMDFMEILPQIASWTRPWCGLEDQVGDGRAITHYGGPVSGGYVDRAFWILEQDLDINHGRVITRGVDVDRLLTY